MFRKILYLLTIPFLTFCGSSDTDEPNPEEQISVCLPKSVTLVLSRLTFEYSDENRLESVTYYRSDGSLEKKDSLEYDTFGKVVKVERITKVAGASRTFEFVYATDDQLEKINETGGALQDEVRVKEFTYDNEGRLVATLIPGSITFGHRYEYNDKGNIDKVYYTVPDFPNTKEVLARELFDYDDTPIFYAQSPELVQYFTFVVDKFPTANNYLRTTVYYESYTTSNIPASNIEYGIEYDENGLVSKVYDKSFISNILIDKALYDCF
jgi:hypothetical protein